ncbi:MAG: peptidyl-prolyl cis-trans isomerase [Candidatus Omnitrophica bacterium]|nr:peptidyl-prolyl cis-trans isomerase [Candidatus Omnitrophota bacterium]MDD5236832.1 peptidyl-prolyl cis-trans isomerase [Candidatus Omnitrophota bacterium]MDD5611225.1 peptidyl-prolyl cis-trans isomerase [Candidatus Omnitrophota bacterium]
MKKIILFCFLLGLFCFASGLYAQEKIVAVVNKEIITQSDLNSYLRFIKMQLAGQYHGRELEEKIAEATPNMLSTLIENKLIVQEAKKQGLKADENRVKARMEEMKSQYPSNKAFEEDMVSHGLTLADMENRTRDQLLMFDIVEMNIKDKIRINPKEVTDFYAEHKDELDVPALRHIISAVTDNEINARKALYELKKGGDFRQVADTCGLSVDDLGEIKPGQLTKELDQVVSVLGVGETSDVINFDKKFYIFKLEEMTPARKRSFDEAKQNIYNYIFDQKMQIEMSKWIDELKSKAYIEIKKENS